MTDWASKLSEPLIAAEHGVAESEEFFGSTHRGPLTFDAIDYPAAQVYLENFQRQTPTMWEVSVSTTLYFEWSRDTDTVEDIIHPLAAVLDETLAEFGDVDCITDYHPASIDFFSGQPQNSLVLAVSVEFRISTNIDPASFSA